MSIHTIEQKRFLIRQVQKKADASASAFYHI